MIRFGTTCDCLLSYHSRDKPAVLDLAQRLRDRGLSVWLDDDHLRPGVLWQQLLEAGIRTSRSVAVLVGASGFGPWDEEAMWAALSLAVEEKKPVIPVLLPGAPAKPPLPLFLSGRTWVDMRAAGTASALDRLIWGITGTPPEPQPVADAGRAYRVSFMRMLLGEDRAGNLSDPDAGHHLHAGETVELPAPEHGVSRGYELDKTAGVETFDFVVSSRPVPRLREAYRAALEKSLIPSEQSAVVREALRGDSPDDPHEHSEIVTVQPPPRPGLDGFRFALPIYGVSSTFDRGSRREPGGPGVAAPSGGRDVAPRPLPRCAGTATGAARCNFTAHRTPNSVYHALGSGICPGRGQVRQPRGRRRAPHGLRPAGFTIRFSFMKRGGHGSRTGRLTR